MQSACLVVLVCGLVAQCATGLSIGRRNSRNRFQNDPLWAARGQTTNTFTTNPFASWFATDSFGVNNNGRVSNPSNQWRDNSPPTQGNSGGFVNPVNSNNNDPWPGNDGRTNGIANDPWDNRRNQDNNGGRVNGQIPTTADPWPNNGRQNTNNRWQNNGRQTNTNDPWPNNGFQTTTNDPWPNNGGRVNGQTPTTADPWQNNGRQNTNNRWQNNGRQTNTNGPWPNNGGRVNGQITTTPDPWPNNGGRVNVQTPTTADPWPNNGRANTNDPWSNAWGTNTQIGPVTWNNNNNNVQYGGGGRSNTCAAQNNPDSCDVYDCFPQQCSTAPNLVPDAKRFCEKSFEVQRRNEFDTQGTQYIKSVRECQTIKLLLSVPKTNCEDINGDVNTTLVSKPLPGGVVTPDDCFFQFGQFCDVVRNEQNCLGLFHVYGGFGYLPYQIFIHFNNLLTKCDNDVREIFKDNYNKKFFLALGNGQSGPAPTPVQRYYTTTTMMMGAGAD